MNDQQQLGIFAEKVGQLDYTRPIVVPDMPADMTPAPRVIDQTGAECCPTCGTARPGPCACKKVGASALYLVK